MSSIPCETDGAARGDAAFEDIVVPLIADTYRTAFRFARQHDEARDLTQEALLRALRGFQHFRPGSNARAWLRTIVHSVFVTRYRQRQREPEMVGYDIERVSGETRGDASGAISDPRLCDALERVPRVFREAIQLVDIDELTYNEAARMLRIPVNTLRSRLFRGRRRLLAMLSCAP